MDLWKAIDGYWTHPTKSRVPIIASDPTPDPDPTPGTTMPDATNTGPPAGMQLQRVDGDVTISQAGQTIEGLDIYGQVIVRAPDAHLRNCIVRGPGPISVYQGPQTALVRGGGGIGLRGITIERCRLDARGRENPWVDGIIGGDVTIIATEIAGVQDGISCVDSQGHYYVRDSWIHDGYYTAWTSGQAGYPSQSGNVTHSDAVQFHQGKDLQFIRCRIGGVRHPGPHPSGGAIDWDTVAYKNSGDDYENAAFMIQQEVSSAAHLKLERVLIQDCWLAGGAATVNFSPKYGNDLSGVELRGNRFMRSTWGPQKYILRNSGTNPIIVGNVFDDNGAPVPIST